MRALRMGARAALAAFVLTQFVPAGSASAQSRVVAVERDLSGGLVALDVFVEFEDGVQASAFVEGTFVGPFAEQLAGGQPVFLEEDAIANDGQAGYDAGRDTWFATNDWDVQQEAGAFDPMAPPGDPLTGDCVDAQAGESTLVFALGTTEAVESRRLAQLVVPSGSEPFFCLRASRQGMTEFTSGPVPVPEPASAASAAVAVLSVLGIRAVRRRR